MKIDETIHSILIKLLDKNAEHNGGKLTPAAEKFRVEMGIPLKCEVSK